MKKNSFKRLKIFNKKYLNFLLYDDSYYYFYNKRSLPVSLLTKNILLYLVLVALFLIRIDSDI